jgi:cobalt-zinc-cadmium efflux system outer membrane protein
MKIIHIFCGVLLLSGIAASVNANNTERPQIEHFVQSLLASHPQMIRAKSKFDAAKAEAMAKQQPLYNPELVVELGRTTENTGIVGLSQTFDWSGKADALSTIGQQELLAASAELKETELLLQIDLLRKLASFSYEKKRSALANKSKSLMERFYKIAIERQQVGEIAQVEVDLIELARLNAIIRTNESQASLSSSKQSLEYFTSVPITNWPSMPSTLPAVPVVENVNQLLLQHPSIKKYESEVHASESEHLLSQRNQNADPTVGLRAGVNDGDNYVGLDFSIPLYVRNSYGSETQASRQRVIEAESTFDDALRQSKYTLNSALIQYRANYNSWQDWQKSGVMTIERGTVNLEAMWEAGELDTTEYLIQLRESLNARSMILQTEYQAWLSWFDWLASSGVVSIE